MRSLAPLATVLVLASAPPQEAPEILSRKWEHRIMERVYLPQPSGWINHMPWLISSPAIGDLGGGPELEVVTGTEEGYGEWFPRGNNSGRYIAVTSRGERLWDYPTDNNAGRASPGLVDLDGDGDLEGTGGSTSGWMLHCFDRGGKRRWRFECERRRNVLAAPASGELTADPGLETVAVVADGLVYAVDRAGRKIWRCRPTGDDQGYYAGAPAAIADVDGDGLNEVVVNLLTHQGYRTFCIEGTSGRVRWTSQPIGLGGNTTTSAPAILPKGDP